MVDTDFAEYVAKGAGCGFTLDCDPLRVSISVASLIRG